MKKLVGGVRGLASAVARLTGNAWVRGGSFLAALALGVYLALRERWLLVQLGWFILFSLTLIIFNIVRQSAALQRLLARRVGDRKVGGRDLTLSTLLTEALPPLLIAGITIGFFWRLLGGDMPISHDHPVHLFKAWLLSERLLPSGRIIGWSSYLFAGFPANALYPLGADLWVTLLHHATLKLLPFTATYALAFFLAMLAQPLAVYALGRCCMGRVAGLVAALLILVDFGGWRQGGWNFTVSWGVWPLSLGLTFTVLALLFLLRVTERGRTRDFIAFAAAFAFAVVSHPMSLLFMAVVLPLALLLFLLDSERGSARLQVYRVLGAVLLGLALCAFWLLPLVADASWAKPRGGLWVPLTEVARGILDGRLFKEWWAWPHVLGLVGLGVAGFRRERVPLLLTCAVLLLLLCASSTFLTEVWFLPLTAALGNVQFERFIIYIKVLWFLLAGYGLQAIIRGVAASLPTSPRLRVPASPRLLILLLATPLITTGVAQFDRRYLARLRGVETTGRLAYWDNYREAMSWLGESERGEDFFRVAYVDTPNGHLFYSAPVFNGRPLLKNGFTPASNFSREVTDVDPETLKALNVKYLVARKPYGRGRSYLEEERRFGRFYIYRFLDYTPERVTLTGPGEIDVLDFEEERIRVRVKGAGPESRLKVHVANFANWRAEVDGRPVEVSEVPIKEGGRPLLMEVPLATAQLPPSETTSPNPYGAAGRSGEVMVELSYRATAAEILGKTATLLGLAVCLGLILLRFRPAWRGAVMAWLRRIAPSRRRVIVIDLLTLAALAALVLGASLALRRTAPGDSVYRLIDHLEETRIWVDQGGKRHECREREWGRIRCGKESWNYVGPTVVKVDGAFRRCIWAHPARRGLLKVSFPAVPGGADLYGHMGLSDQVTEGGKRGAPVAFGVEVDGVSRLQVEQPQERAWTPFEVALPGAGRKLEVTFTVSSPNHHRRHFCFEAELVPR